MASSDNLASLDPFLYRSAFSSDPWFNFSDSNPISADAGFSPSDDSLYDVLVNTATKTTPDTPRSSVSGSDPEIPISKRSGPGPSSGRVGKRKARVSKKNPTTYITADAANFRQMVQQVTGVKLPSSAQIPPMILKPEPQRIPGGGIFGNAQIQGCLPTLDTSSLLLGPGGAAGAASTAFSVPSAVDFDSFPCFPTLDSWNAS